MTINNNDNPNWDYLGLLKGAPESFRYVPVNGNKQPTGGKGWNLKPLTLEEVCTKKPDAVGLLLGPVSGGIVDIDFDGPGSFECFEREMGHHVDELPKTIQWSSGKPGRSHRIYRISPEYFPHINHHRREYKVNGETRLELRWDKHMSVVCGTHPETGQYHFEQGYAPTDVNEVPLAPEWLIKPLLESKTKSGQQAKGNQKEIEQARMYLSRINPHECTDYDTWLKVLMALHSVSHTMIEDAVLWSSKMPNFDEEECYLKWKSFEPDGGIGIGTLKYLSEIYDNQPERKQQPLLSNYLGTTEATDSLSSMSAMSSMDIMEKIASKHQRLNQFAEITDQVVSQYGNYQHLSYLLRQASNHLELNLSSAEVSQFINTAVQSQTQLKAPIHGGDVVSAESTPWLLEDILLLSTINLLVALPKTGKTSFLISLIAAYVKEKEEYIGKSFHDKIYPILIIGTDQPDSDWMRMLKRGGLIDSNNRLHSSIVALYTTSRPLYFDEKGFDEIENWCKQHEHLILIVDSYSRVTSPLGKEEKSEQFALAVIELSKRIAPYDATAIIVHHSNKIHQEGSASLQSRGTTALPAAASQILSLSRVSDSGMNCTQSDSKVSLCQLRTEGRAGAPQDLILKSCSNGWELANPIEGAYLKRSHNGMTKVEDKALDYINNIWSEYSAGVSTHSLAEYLEWPGEAGYKRAMRLLKKLHQSGKIDMTTASKGFGGGAPSQLYIPLGLEESQLKSIMDISDIIDAIDEEA